MASSLVTVAIVLAPGFPLMSLSACTESLRIANRELGRVAFNRVVVTTDDSVATSSSGFVFNPDEPLAARLFAPVVIVLSSYQPEKACRPDFLAWLRKQQRLGAIICCVDTASYILAKAETLGSNKVAVHRESLPGYREILGDAALLDRHHAVDGDLFSSAGGTATLDMMLALIARFQGQLIADRVAYVLNYRPPSAESSTEETSHDGAITRVESRLARMIELMQTNIESPLTIAVVYKQSQVPPATGNRLFLRYFGTTPNRYYLRMRLERAQSLLTDSPLPISEIAAKVGFESASAFSRSFQRHFGKLPSCTRRFTSV